jgi:hypothetical protein
MPILDTVTKNVVANHPEAKSQDAKPGFNPGLTRPPLLYNEFSG